MTTSALFVRAVRTLDCARKLRVHYLLPRAVDDAWLESLGDVDVRVTDFSRYVAGAKKQFELRLGDDLYASGVVGQSRIVATFGKLGRTAHENLVHVFDALLVQHFGDVRHENPPAKAS